MGGIEQSVVPFHEAAASRTKALLQCTKQGAGGGQAPLFRVDQGWPVGVRGGSDSGSQFRSSSSRRRCGKIIYTTNSIESLNYQLRKIIKNRGHFPNDDAVVKLLWLAIRDIEDKRARERAKEAGRPRNERKAPPKLVEGAVVQGWNAAYGALSLAFPGRLEPVL